MVEQIVPLKSDSADGRGSVGRMYTESVELGSEYPTIDLKLFGDASISR